MVYNSNADSQDIVSTVLDKAEATVNVYPLKRITRNFNAVLDIYCSWAFEADGRWSFDDLNETSPPIDKQNLVSGTNRYKFDDFTEKIINLIKLEALDSDGNGIELIPEDFNTLGSGAVSFGDTSKTFQELYLDADSGTPSRYCKYGDFVYLRDNPNYSESDGLIAYFNRPAAYMASTDTTKVPGVPVIHHPLLCELAANQFRHDKEKISLSEKMAFEQYAKDIVKDHFARRNEDVRNIIKPRITQFR